MLLMLGLLPPTLVSALLASAPSTQAPFAQSGSGVRPGASSPGGAPASASAEALWADVRRFALSPDETRIVYLADAETDELEELYSIKTTGGAPLKLNAPFPAGRRGVLEFEVSADGRRILYEADHEAGPRFMLYSVSVDGGPIVTLQASNGPQAFEIAPDGKRALFVRDNDNRVELRLASLASGASVRISSTDDVTAFQITPDGARVVFGEHTFRSGPHALFSASLERPGDVVQLTPLVASGSLNGRPPFSISSDSTHVLYVNRDGGVRGDLHSVPVDGSAPPVALTDLGDGNVDEWTTSSDGSLAVFSVGADVYAVPVDGSGAPVRLSDGPAFDWLLSPSGRVAYMDRVTTTPVDLFAAPLEGGADTFLAAAARELLGFTPKGDSALYVDLDAPGFANLQTVRLDGSAAPTFVAALPQSTRIPDSGFPLDAGFEFDLSSGRLVFRLSGSGMLGGLFSAPLDGSSPLIDLGKLPAGAVLQFDVAPSLARVFFAGTALTPGVVELFAVPVDGSSLPKVLVDL